MTIQMFLIHFKGRRQLVYIITFEFVVGRSVMFRSSLGLMGSFSFFLLKVLLLCSSIMHCLALLILLRVVLNNIRA